MPSLFTCKIMHYQILLYFFFKNRSIKINIVFYKIFKYKEIFEFFYDKKYADLFFLDNLQIIY